MGIITEQDNAWMRHALRLAECAAALGEVPVGAVVVLNNTIIGEGFNQPITQCDPTAHAEIVALRNAAKHSANYRLVDADLYVTLEPCSMCAGAIVHSRIRRVIYAATEPKAGVVQSQGQFFQHTFLNHRVAVVSGVLAQESTQLLQQFFQHRRQIKRNNTLES